MKWDSIALGELALERGGSVDPADYPDEVFELYSIPAFDAGKPEVLRGSQIGSAKKAVQTDDVMISRIVPHIRRACVVAEKKGYRQIASGEWIIFRSQKVWPQYLRWVLVGDTFHSEFMRTVSGVGGSLLRARPTEVFKIEIILPPLAEQKRIAGILDAADALRAKRREALAQLDTLLQATFLDLFGDPVSNPKGWEIVKFADIGLSRLGKMLDGAKQTGTSRFPYLANTNVQWGRFELSDLREMDFAEDDRKEFSLQDGDLLVCEGGEVGRSAIWRGQMRDVYFQKALHRVRLDAAKSVPEYIQRYMWFMAKRGGFKDFTTSVTIAHLTGVSLKKLPVPLPPIELQRYFVEITQSIERQQVAQRAHLSELDTLFASLQSRAFRGEL